MLIRGATIVGNRDRGPMDLRIEGQRIAQIGVGLDARADETFPAEGLHLLPGLIDDQVHFREPGYIHKAEIATESAAAVAGGITSYLEMPNTSPVTADFDLLRAKYGRAAEASAANYGFYLGATGDNGAALREAAGSEACGIKVFLGASTGDLLVHERERLEEVFAAVPEGMVLAAHCEDHERILERQREHIERLGEGLPIGLHPEIRDVEACLRSTEQAISLAKKHGTRLHVLHITTAEELELFERAPLSGKLVTAEACVHHLFFTADDYADRAGRIKCNPAIKESRHREAIRAALRDGRIDVLATDHAPHLLSEKEGGYAEIAAGLPLVEHSLLVMLELVAEDVITLEELAALGARTPAQLFSITDRGRIEEGCFADLVLVDLKGETVASDASARSKCGWTPFDGHRFPASIEATWVSGRLAYAGGEVRPGIGMQLGFRKPR